MRALNTEVRQRADDDVSSGESKGGECGSESNHFGPCTATGFNASRRIFHDYALGCVHAESFRGQQVAFRRRLAAEYVLGGNKNPGSRKPAVSQPPPRQFAAARCHNGPLAPGEYVQHCHGARQCDDAFEIGQLRLGKPFDLASGIEVRGNLTNCFDAAAAVSPPDEFRFPHVMALRPTPPGALHHASRIHENTVKIEEYRGTRE